ncbi:MAG: V-type ATP synthase subunit D [Ruminococcaceae bacterium]|nr:V-type ATP synthase subunit D [Oscillospiraceae bacterium]
MEYGIVPTKGNLLSAKKSYKLALLGYELMDKKKNILVREMMGLLDRASEIQKKINETFLNAYKALQTANISHGICEKIAYTTAEEKDLNLKFRSVMGVELPMVELERKRIELPYGLASTDAMTDDAYCSFIEVKYLCADLAQVENSVYRLAMAIKKTQKRANALKNIIIPKYEYTIKYITDSLEEKEREEFTRLKVIKNQKMKIEEK